VFNEDRHQNSLRTQIHGWHGPLIATMIVWFLSVLGGVLAASKLKPVMLGQPISYLSLSCPVLSLSGRPLPEGTSSLQTVVLTVTEAA